MRSVRGLELFLPGLKLERSAESKNLPCWPNIADAANRQIHTFLIGPGQPIKSRAILSREDSLNIAKDFAKTWTPRSVFEI
jgi:hypothetical protein